MNQPGLLVSCWLWIGNWLEARGIGGGPQLLFCLLLWGCGPLPREPAPATSEVLVVVRTDHGEPLEGVMVRVGQERSVSDEEGVARFSLRVDISAMLTAECPPHTKGEPLVRELRPAALRAASEWKTTLTCRPTVVQQCVALFAEGCDEAEVWLDGTPLGTTSGGLLHALRPIDKDGVARVEVRSAKGRCEWEAAGLDVAFSWENPGIWAHFRGKKAAVPRPPRIVRVEPKPSRPYRL